MLKSRDVCKEGRRVRNPLTEIRRNDEQIILPSLVVEAKCSDQSISNRHEQYTRSNERDELPVARHNKAGNQSTYWSC